MALVVTQTMNSPMTATSIRVTRRLRGDMAPRRTAWRLAETARRRDERLNAYTVKQLRVDIMHSGTTERSTLWIHEYATAKSFFIHSSVTYSKPQCV